MVVPITRSAVQVSPASFEARALIVMVCPSNSFQASQTRLPRAVLNARYTGAWAVDVEADGDDAAVADEAA